jgi:hypothetical protein
MVTPITGSGPGSLPPADIFEPYMPEVDARTDLDEVFEKARRQSAGEGPDGARQVVVVTPGRMLMGIPAPPAGSMPETTVQPARALLKRPGPLNVAVIAHNRLAALTDEQGKMKAIPFLGHLLGFAYLGHHVVVFEGHPSAYEAGVRGADVLLIDSGMLPFLRDDWAAVAFAAMNPGARVYVHNRERYILYPVVPSKFPPGWLYSEHDGEASYANCLLTTFAKGRHASVEIMGGAPLPDLSRLADDPEELDWISTLPFDYAALNAEQVMAAIRRLAKPVRKGLFRKELVLKTRLMQKSGASMHAFRLTEGRTPQGRPRLRLEKM